MNCTSGNAGASFCGQKRTSFFSSRQESNLDHELRKLAFYPLNYGRFLQCSTFGVLLVDIVRPYVEKQNHVCARKDEFDPIFLIDPKSMPAFVLAMQLMCS